MQRDAIESSGPSSTETELSNGSHGDAKYTRAYDDRKRPIRGLWIRNGKYYAQMTVEDPISGKKSVKRVPLTAATAGAAKKEMDKLKVQRDESTLPILTLTPKFSDYAKRYLELVSSGQGAKKPGTLEKERTILNRWTGALGGLRLNQIKRMHVNQFIDARLKENVAPRTINLDVITFRVVMKRAFSDGLIQRLPTEGLKPLRTSTEKRSLFSTAQLDALCNTAFRQKTGRDGKAIPLTENAQQFVDYIRLMGFSGCRRNEALGLQWNDVDFDNQQLFVRRQVATRKKRGTEEQREVFTEDLKNSEQRVVDFNPNLQAHLLEMKTRRAPDSQWLFPSPQRGDKDIPAKTFRESLGMVRTEAKLPRFNFHDCRHYFISMCVMSGIDFMTIAEWVGHKDGGILIGKVYGHLADEHRKRQAQKVIFSPRLAEPNAVSS